MSMAYSLSVSDIKDIDPSTTKCTFLTEEGREGVFVWKTGDYSNLVSADPRNGMFVESLSTPTGLGAWVRVFAPRSSYSVDWWGTARDGVTDNSAAFNAARSSNQTAALNEFLTYEPTSATPDKMLLIDAANYQALECARLTNVPPYLVGVSTGAYSYQSSEQARADLYIFGVQAYSQCLAATLSQNNVLPRGTYVEFDTHDFLVENEMADKMDSPDLPEENTQEELA